MKHFLDIFQKKMLKKTSIKKNKKESPFKILKRFKL